MFKCTKSPVQQDILVACHHFTETSDKTRKIDEGFRSCCVPRYTSTTFVVNADSKQKVEKRKRYSNSSYPHNSMYPSYIFHVYGDELP